MDLWDVTKLMWRRWYITAPMLLVTTAAAIWIFATVGPEYQATGHVAVVPPEVHRAAEAGQASRVNPWNEEALAHAASIRLEAKRLEDEMAANGYEGEWGVEVTGRLPVITIEVVAPTADEAVDIMHQLQSIVENEIRDRQVAYNLPGEEEITTVRLDDGESIETTASRLRRVLVAVVGAGLVLTVGFVLAFDALARWRRSRAAFPPPPEEAAGRAEPPAEVEEPRRRYAYASATEASAAPEPVRVAANGASKPHTGNGDRPPEVAPAEPAEPAEPVSPAVGSPAMLDAAESHFAVPDDSTVVLPLSGAPWAGRPQASWPPKAGDAAHRDDPGAGRH